MTETLALPHIVSLLFGGALASGPRPAGELYRSAPTSFFRQAEVAQLVASENPELAYDIQTLNPSSEALFDRLEKTLAGLRKAVRESDRATYHRQMEVSRAVLEREETNRVGAHRVGAPR